MSNAFVGIICGAVGAGLLMAGLREANVVRQLRRRGIRSPGLVIRNVRIETSESGHIWAPIIAYTDQRGYQVEFTTKIRGTGVGLAVGQQVTIVYLPDRSGSARVLMRRHMLGPVWFRLVAGIVFSAAGIIILLR